MRKTKGNMKSWFLKREYPERLISAEMDKVKFSSIERKSRSKTQKGIPIVVTYHPLFKSFSGIVIINIYYIWIKKLRGHLLHNPWFLTGVCIN